MTMRKSAQITHSNETGHLTERSLSTDHYVVFNPQLKSCKFKIDLWYHIFFLLWSSQTCLQSKLWNASKAHSVLSILTRCLHRKVSNQCGSKTRSGPASFVLKGVCMCHCFWAHRAVTQALQCLCLNCQRNFLLRYVKVTSCHGRKTVFFFFAYFPLLLSLILGFVSP